MELSEEWAGLPYHSQQRLPITAALPYFYRWKINNLKLMLNDLKDLIDKHEIVWANDLYRLIAIETEDMCKVLCEEVQRIRYKRMMLLDKGEESNAAKQTT